MTRADIVEHINDLGLEDEEIILFDGMEDAFLGIAERFEDHGHVYFAVYSYEKMVLIVEEDMDVDDAIDYLEFNVVGLYAGPGTPAILRDF